MPGVRVAAFKSIGSYILLHGAFFLLVMFLILWLIETERARREVAVMAVSSIAPFVLLSFAILGLMFVLPSTMPYWMVTAADIKLALAFPILWRWFRIDVRLALIYTMLLLVAAQFSPVFVRALLQLFEGRPGAMLFVLAAGALPVALWIATRSIKDSNSQLFTRCTLLAALIAPTVLVGHGGMAVLPAGMVWPFLFQRGVGMGTQVVSLFISMLVTTFVLLLVYRAIGKAKSEAGGAAGSPETQS